MEDSYQLALKAKQAHEQADSQQAQELLYKAIQNTGPSPDSDTLDTLAEICGTLGDNALAYTLYAQSIKASPYSNPQKYMSLAQLSSGLEAKQLYEAGICVLTNKLKETSDESELQALRSQLASAFAAIAELHMTDLCDEENAENTCESSISQAIAIQDTCIDAWQSLCNLRLIRGRVQEASEAMNKVKLILRSLGESNLPSISFLGETLRMCVELEDFEGGEEVSEFAVSIDDSMNDVIYMVAFIKFRLGKHEEAREALSILAERQDLDDEIRAAAQEIERELTSL